MRPQPVSPCLATRSSGSDDSLLDRFHTRVASSGQRGQLARLLDGISGLPSAEPPTTELLSPWLRALPVFLVAGHPLFSAYRSAIGRADLVEEMGHYRAGSAKRPHSLEHSPPLRSSMEPMSTSCAADNSAPGSVPTDNRGSSDDEPGRGGEDSNDAASLIRLKPTQTLRWRCRARSARHLRDAPSWASPPRHWEQLTEFSVALS